MYSISDLKSDARQNLKRNYGTLVLVALLLAFISGSLITSSSGNTGSWETERMESFDENLTGFKVTVDEFFGLSFPALAGIIGFFALIFAIIYFFLVALVLNPLEVGCIRFFTLHSRGEASLSDLLYPFRTNYRNVVKIMLLRDIYLFFWFLLFIIPGFIKMYSYRLIPFLLAEDANITSREAFDSTLSIMKGFKFHTFLFDLSFIGWKILAMLTFGLSGVLYSNPYFYLADSELYLSLKEYYYSHCEYPSY